jgi:hypothetical protein
MNAKPIPPKEMVLIALMFPILGILFGGIYSYPAGRLTKERDPWFTLLLATGLAFSIFGIGYFVHASPSHLGMVWLASIVLLLLVRAAFGLRGNFEHFGMVHIATLLILFAVLIFTRHPNRTSSNRSSLALTGGGPAGRASKLSGAEQARSNHAGGLP